MSGSENRGNKDDDGGSNNEGTSMVSKIVTLACAAVAAVVLISQEDDNGDGNESGVMVLKVVIATTAAMAAHALVDRLFAVVSPPCSCSHDHDDSKTTHDQKCWSFPPYGWIKCNVDGSAPDNKASGCGGVFRDCTGCWCYGFARSFDRCEPSAAELEAIYTGLNIAWDRGFHKLILETDSLTVAQVVNKVTSAHNAHEKILVKMIRSLLEDRKWNVKIVHIYREGNKVADWLANLSHGLPVGDQIELSELPGGCHSCLDLMLDDVRLAKTN